MAQITDTEAAELKAFADGVIWKAMVAMQEHGVGYELMMDRLLTAAGAHIARQEGSAQASAVFRRLAKNIERGAFAAVDRRSIAN